MTCVSDITVKRGASVVPNFTAFVAVNPPHPLIVTLVPPEIGPAFGVTDVTVGKHEYVNRSAGVIALVPAGVVTVTSTTAGGWL
jgi:hypothetical protein